MLDKLYYKDSHLTSLAFLMLDNDELNLEEKQLVLAHINTCDKCMDKYIESLTDESLLEPNSNLASKIINAIDSQEHVKKGTKVLTIQFVKLAVAVCLTMVIFFSGALGITLNTPHHIQNNIDTTQSEKPKPKVEKDNNKFDFFDSFTSSFNRGFSGLADQINIGFKGDAKYGAK